MGVYIKGMEMPTNCGECELCACYVFEDGTEENYRCPMTMYPIHDFDERHYLCPLVPVPPHGRLIDAAARVNVQMYNDEFEDFQTVNMSIDDLLDSSWIELEDDPTIIPEDHEEEEMK